MMYACPTVARNQLGLLTDQLRLGTITKFIEFKKVTNFCEQWKATTNKFCGYTVQKFTEWQFNSACLILYKKLQDNLTVKSVCRLLQCSYGNQRAKSDKSAEKTLPDFGLRGLFFVELLLKGILVK